MPYGPVRQTHHRGRWLNCSTLGTCHRRRFPGFSGDFPRQRRWSKNTKRRRRTAPAFKAPCADARPPRSMQPEPRSAVSASPDSRVSSGAPSCARSQCAPARDHRRGSIGAPRAGARASATDANSMAGSDSACSLETSLGDAKRLSVFAAFDLPLVLVHTAGTAAAGSRYDARGPERFGCIDEAPARSDPDRSLRCAHIVVQHLARHSA